MEKEIKQMIMSKFNEHDQSVILAYLGMVEMYQLGYSNGQAFINGWDSDVTVGDLIELEERAGHLTKTQGSTIKRQAKTLDEARTMIANINSYNRK